MDKSSQKDVRPHLDLTKEDTVKFTSYKTAVCKSGTKLDLSTYPSLILTFTLTCYQLTVIGLGEG